MKGKKNKQEIEEIEELQAQPPELPGTEPAEQEPLTPEQENEELLDRLRRLGADFQNYKKRVQKEISQAQEFANESLIRDLLPILDDMERALSAAGENHGTDDPLYRGMQLLHDKMIGILESKGLARIETGPVAFDPELHSALMQEETDQQEPNTVLRELQKGYRLRNRTIRPASVVVAKAPAEDSPEEPQEE